jgi:hypothetical protein
MSADVDGTAQQAPLAAPGGSGERDAEQWTTVQGQQRRRAGAAQGQVTVAVLDPRLWKGGNLTVPFEVLVRFERLPGGARHSDLHSPVALAFGRLLAAYMESTCGEGTSTGAERVHVASVQAYPKHDTKSGCTTFHAHFLGTPALLQFLTARLQGGFLHLPAPVDGPAALIVDGACLRRVRILGPPALWVEDHCVAAAALAAGWGLRVHEFHQCLAPWMHSVTCAMPSSRAIEVTLALPSAASLPDCLHIDDDQGQRQVSMRVDAVIPKLPPPVCLTNVVAVRRGGLPPPPPLGLSGAGAAVLPQPAAAGGSRPAQPPGPLVPARPSPRSGPGSTSAPQRPSLLSSQPPRQLAPLPQPQRSPAQGLPPPPQTTAGGSGGRGKPVQQGPAGARIASARKPSAGATVCAASGSRFAVLADLATDAADAALPVRVQQQQQRDGAPASSPAGRVLLSQLAAAAAAAAAAPAATVTSPEAVTSPLGQAPPAATTTAAGAALLTKAAAPPPSSAVPTEAEAVTGAEAEAAPLAAGGNPPTPSKRRRFTPNIPPQRPRRNNPADSLPSTPTKSRALDDQPAACSPGAVAAVANDDPNPTALPVLSPSRQPDVPPPSIEASRPDTEAARLERELLDGGGSAAASEPVEPSACGATGTTCQATVPTAKASKRAPKSKAVDAVVPVLGPSQPPVPAAAPSLGPAASASDGPPPLTRQQSAAIAAAASKKRLTSSAPSSRGPSPAPSSREAVPARRSAPSVVTMGAPRRA